MNVSVLFCTVVLVICSSICAVAADHQVLMKGAAAQSMDFEPAFIKIAKGDTVTFVPDSAGHNVASIDGMAPAGSMPWVGAIDERLTITFDAEGLHGFQCPHHLERGMIGLIQVGDAEPGFDPSKAIADLPDRAKSYMKVLLKKAGVEVTGP